MAQHSLQSRVQRPPPKGNRLLSAIVEFESPAQFSRGGVLETPDRGRISIEMAMSQVPLNYRISLELPPKPLIRSLPHPNQNNNRRVPDDPEKSQPEKRSKSEKGKRN